MEFIFQPTEEFKWEREYPDGSKVLVGEYYPDMTYNCTKSPTHDALRDKCDEWEKAGKIIKIPLKKGEYFKKIVHNAQS